MSVFCIVDDKHIPVSRILWVSDLPHFCGSSDCEREGQYEIRLEQGESVWATSPQQRDTVLEVMQAWYQGRAEEDEDAPDP